MFGLLDTTGYSAEIQAKYAGMMIVERKAMVGGVAVGTGAYGFGLQKPTPAEGPGKLMVYDVGGAKVGEATGRVRRRARPAGAAAGVNGRAVRRPPLGRDQVASHRRRRGSGESPSASSTQVVPVGRHVPELVHLPARPAPPGRGPPSSPPPRPKCARGSLAE